MIHRLDVGGALHVSAEWSLIRDGFKLIETDDKTLLFNLSDPDETSLADVRNARAGGADEQIRRGVEGSSRRWRYRRPDPKDG
jgi:hypothetical protein